MEKAIVTIRIGYKDWKYLQKIFPAFENESMASYFRRYIAKIKELNNGN